MVEGLQNFRALESREVPIQPHPQSPGISVQYLVSQAVDDAEVTCALVHLRVGCRPLPHVHENSDDLLYVLRGNGKLWVSSLGTHSLVPETFVLVPRGVLHAPMEIDEDLLIYMNIRSLMQSKEMGHEGNSQARV